MHPAIRRCALRAGGILQSHRGAMTSIRYPLATTTALAILLIASASVRAEGSPDDVLVQNSVAKLTRGEYEADLMRVPPDQRASFASDPKRVALMVSNMLLAKTLAAEARAAGVDRDPKVAQLLALETDRALSAVELRRIEEAAAAEFDAKGEPILAKARELYLLDKDKYRTPEQVQASHILLDTRIGNDAAIAKANETRAKILAGADFATLATEISDDPSAKANHGELGCFGTGQMDPAFTKAAFELKAVGEISMPVQSRFGYHLIRLEGRRPARQLSFDEVKEKILADMRTRYISEQRDAKLAAIRNDPTLKIDQKALESLVYQLDPQSFKRALQQSN